MATLNINRGTTYTIKFQYRRNGENRTLVGATVRFTMKSTEFDDNMTDATALVLKNITDGDENGQADIAILPADTKSITPRTYFYDIKVQESGGEIYKVDEGRIKLDGSPTNRGA